MLILPFHAYNEYEQQFKETFNDVVECKKYLDSFIRQELMQQPETVETVDNLSNETVETVDNNINNISTQPLPLLDFDHANKPDESNPSVRIALLMKQLHDVAEMRDDINQFILYLSEKYGIDLNEPVHDLPFEVIDEILTYIDYDPDIDGDIDLNSLVTSSCSNENNENEDEDDQLIIPTEHIRDFQNILNRFNFGIKTLKHLNKLNAITNERVDEDYYKFQNIFKPMITSLIKLYKINYHDYSVILQESIEYHEKKRQEQIMKSIDWDFEYSDHDW